jgi:phenylalanyl-tRNA synthetase beta chain
MKVPLPWLKEFVDVPGTADEIARTMSVRGFAVEGVEHRESLSAEASAKADAVIDFEVTANRPDCMSIVGMAREVATAYELPLKAGAETSRGASLHGSPEREASDIDIVLDAPDLCPRYAGAVADVTVGDSPSWMQDRLQACGIRPISNIVDITNYVLLELGQPMHAFDLARIRGGQIRVRKARAGESLKTLDGQVRTLTANMLAIADAERAIAVAGVMGGADSEVGNGTQAIVFESAYFNPLSVRRTSKALGLKTEASMRFERGADPHLPRIAMQRALELLEKIGAGKRRGGVLDRFGQRVGALLQPHDHMRSRRAAGMEPQVVASGHFEGQRVVFSGVPAHINRQPVNRLKPAEGTGTSLLRLGDGRFSPVNEWFRSFLVTE